MSGETPRISGEGASLGEALDSDRLRRRNDNPHDPATRTVPCSNAWPFNDHDHDAATRRPVCKRKACSNLAQVCGGHCPECFPRWLAKSGPRPEVVVLCGSTRFKAEFEEAERRLGREGKIVLTVSMFGHSGDLTAEECADGHPVKTALDLLHKQKIDMADRVLVINPGGYIGTSTRSEIEYAEWFEKPIDYLETAAVASGGATSPSGGNEGPPESGEPPADEPCQWCGHAKAEHRRDNGGCDMWCPCSKYEAARVAPLPDTAAPEALAADMREFVTGRYDHSFVGAGTVGGWLERLEGAAAGSGVGVTSPSEGPHAAPICDPDGDHPTDSPWEPWEVDVRSTLTGGLGNDDEYVDWVTDAMRDVRVFTKRLVDAAAAGGVALPEPPDWKEALDGAVADADRAVERLREIAAEDAAAIAALTPEPPDTPEATA